MDSSRYVLLGHSICDTNFNPTHETKNSEIVKESFNIIHVEHTFKVLQYNTKYIVRNYL